MKIFRQHWPEEAEEEVKEAILEEYIDDAYIELQDVVDRLFIRMSWTRKTIADLTVIMNRRNLESCWICALTARPAGCNVPQVSIFPS